MTNCNVHIIKGFRQRLITAMANILTREATFHPGRKYGKGQASTDEMAAAGAHLVKFLSGAAENDFHPSLKENIIRGVRTSPVPIFINLLRTAEEETALLREAVFSAFPGLKKHALEIESQNRGEGEGILFARTRRKLSRISAVQLEAFGFFVNVHLTHFNKSIVEGLIAAFPSFRLKKEHFMHIKDSWGSAEKSIQRIRAVIFLNHPGLEQKVNKIEAASRRGSNIPSKKLRGARAKLMRINASDLVSYGIHSKFWKKFFSDYRSLFCACFPDLLLPHQFQHAGSFDLRDKEDVKIVLEKLLDGLNETDPRRLLYFKNLSRQIEIEPGVYFSVMALADRMRHHVFPEIRKRKPGLGFLIPEKATRAAAINFLIYHFYPAPERAKMVSKLKELQKNSKVLNEDVLKLNLTELKTEGLAYFEKHFGKTWQELVWETGIFDLF